MIATLEQCHTIDSMFHFIEFGELTYALRLMHRRVASYSGFQYAFASSSKKTDSEIAHLLELVVILEMPLQMKADGAQARVSIRIQYF